MISRICTTMLELLIKPKIGLGRLGMKSITILPVAYLGYAPLSSPFTHPQGGKQQGPDWR